MKPNTKLVITDALFADYNVDELYDCKYLQSLPENIFETQEEPYPFPTHWLYWSTFYLNFNATTIKIQKCLCFKLVAIQRRHSYNKMNICEFPRHAHKNSSMTVDIKGNNLRQLIRVKN
jgi:hypothetical protein